MGIVGMAEGLLPLWGTLWAVGMGFLWTIIPKEYYFTFHTWIRRLQKKFTYYASFEIQEFSGAGNNEIYDFVQSYLSSNSAIAADYVNLSRPKNASYNTFSLGRNETIEDTSFMDSKVWWTHEIFDREIQSNAWSEIPNDEIRRYVLKIRKQDKSRLLAPYVQHVIDTAKKVKELSRDRLLYTNMKESGGYPFRKKAWQSVPLKNPSTFDTLAMDPVLKEEIKKDLIDFTHGKEFYEMAGKPWKRGYLLYGPPGTGKSSMIGAIANFLKYDIYDLELTEVKSNCELRNLLIQTTDRSILVIEDIDCTVNLAERAKAQKETKKDKPDEEGSKVTLSGVLNFTDGLWSCCGSERIVIFTTNYVDKLDPALLRTGRMDKKIHMSWCQFPAFRVLAKNNLRLEWHDLFPQIEEAMAGKAVTPADVSEFLLKKRDDPTAALEGLLEALGTAPLVSEKPAMKWELNQFNWSNESVLADANPEADSSPESKETPSEAVANGSSVSTPESKETPSEAVANGSSSVSTPESKETPSHVNGAAANGVSKS